MFWPQPHPPSHRIRCRPWLLIGAWLATLAFPTRSVAAAPSRQVMIDEAAAHDLADFAPVGSTSWPGTRPRNVKATRAAYLLAVAVHHDPAATTTQGTVLRNRLQDHLRRFIAAGQEPNASGGIEGWSHGAVAQTVVLARHTPAVWNGLSALERAKLDGLMKALAIAAHWGFDDGNDFKTGLDMRGTFDKRWDNNITEGYMSVLLAAAMYFGAAELDRIFVSFDYGTYIHQFTTWGWTNITSTWRRAGRALMETGGSDGRGGTGAGVRTPFTYQGIPPRDVLGLLRARIDATHPHRVADRGANGAAFILNGGSSPTLDHPGMLQEFEHTDASGPRSDALYAYETWMNSVPARASVQLLGHWAAGSSSDRAAITIRMENGARDLIYKLDQGYVSHSNGRSRTITATTNSDNAADTPAIRGYFLVRAVWDDVLSAR